jgi:glycosyltransferase involved in cell wall biosynthesis
MKTAAGLIPYYAFAGCFVLPSTREPWGLVVNEAMAAGLPVIVSNRCGCAEDLVHTGQNGYLFDAGADGALESRMNAITNLPASDLARMGLRSQEIISNYSPDRWALEVANCLAI